jgi:hypothetical protein
MSLVAVSRAGSDLVASLGFALCAPYYDNSRVGSDCLELLL